MADTLHYLAQQLLTKATQLAQSISDIERRTTIRLNHHDGWPTSSWPDGTPRGNTLLTGVEAAASQRLAVTAGQSTSDHPGDAWGGLEQLRDDLIAANSMLSSMLIIRNRLLATTRDTAPEPPKAAPSDRCCGGTTRRWTDLGGLEWGDPLCTELTHAWDLCARHVLAARAWCTAHGIDWVEPTPTQRSR